MEGTSACTLSLFATIQWGECTAESVQAQWQQRLKLLEDENIDFLLTLQNKDKATIEVISSAVDVVLQHVNRAEKWTEEAEATLATTAANMSQFETLNNHMEVHYKNSIALQEALGAMIRVHATNPSSRMSWSTQTIVDPSLPKILEAIQRLEGAIKSVDSYPAKEVRSATDCPAHGMGGKTSQWNINLSFSHASSESTISISASTLLQQALDHIVPLCIAEQTFVHGMFFTSNKHQKPEPVELTVLMERLFEKYAGASIHAILENGWSCRLPKRLVEFGDAGVSANVFEAVSMIVTAQQQLKAIDGSSEYIVNTLLNFQLHLKRSLSKYMEEQLQQLSEHSLPLKQFADDSFVEYSKNLDAYVMWLWECEVGKFTVEHFNLRRLHVSATVLKCYERNTLLATKCYGMELDLTVERLPSSVPSSAPIPLEPPVGRALFINDVLATATAMASLGKVYAGNDVCTSKYTLLSFLPKTLLEQFRRVANFYFLIISLLQLGTPYSPTNKYSTIVPLIMVLFEAIEDKARHDADRAVNQSKTEVFDVDGQTWIEILWKDLRVGGKLSHALVLGWSHVSADLVRVVDSQPFPADMVLLTSSSNDGQVYVETANLDGETDLKEHSQRQSVEIALTINNLVLRGMTLTNTSTIVGVVVAAGSETKLMLNSKKTPSKFSRLDAIANRCIMLIFSVLFIVCCVSTGLSMATARHKGQLARMVHLTISSDDPEASFLSSFLTYLILYNNLVRCVLRSSWVSLGRLQVPISLYISLEVVKWYQAKNMESDLAMMVLKYIHVNNTVFEKTPTVRPSPHSFGLIGSLQVTRQTSIKRDSSLQREHLTALHQADRLHTMEAADIVIDYFPKLQALGTEPTIFPGSELIRASSPDETALLRAAKLLNCDFLGRSENIIEIRFDTACLALACAYKRLSFVEFSTWFVAYCKAKTSLVRRGAKLTECARSMETNLIILGATGVEDQLQDGVTECIEALSEAGADFAIGQFRFLSRLILVHGRWNYRRVSIVILFSFYKNMALIMTLFAYSFLNGHSGQTLYESYLMVGWNALYTFFPILVLGTCRQHRAYFVLGSVVVGIKDEDISAEAVMRFPFIYRTNQLDKELNIEKMRLWVGNALLHSFLVFVLTTFLVYKMGTHSIPTAGVFVYGTAVYGILVVTVCAKAAMIMQHVHRWSKWHYLSIVSGPALFVIFVASYSEAFELVHVDAFSDFFGLGRVLFTSVAFWLGVLVVSFSSLLLDFVVMYLYRMYLPTNQVIIEEIDCRLERRVTASMRMRSSSSLATSLLFHGNWHKQLRKSTHFTEHEEMCWLLAKFERDISRETNESQQSDDKDMGFIVTSTPPIHPITMEFMGEDYEPLEAEYNRSFAERQARRIRVLVILVLVFIPPYAVTEYVYEQDTDLYPYRIAMFCCTLGYLFYIKSEKFLSTYHMSVSIPLGLAGLVVNQSIKYTGKFSTTMFAIVAFSIIRVKFVYTLWLVLFNVAYFILSNEMGLTSIEHSSESSDDEGVLFAIFMVYLVVFAAYDNYQLQMTMKLEFVQLRILKYEEHRSRDILKNMLPSHIVKKLENGETLVSDEEKGVALLFCDVGDAASLTKRYNPREVRYRATMHVEMEC
ncbi:hypothetical protein DYB32_001300 [Aphanomyces invadans]|uniref:P-type phospholipid transporter n=1 Tax=Aphanomyces invadans TaxID=157072 RepID=A0A3R6VH52_9STRA|nr:hypothetical protein DYB32_001300 [Aphanomyces invadans]